ncbi:MAG: hypothetical protein HYU97_09215 [Deltaproteobacteria bacterium]|nr:hypothetical protein [Deltaproteobacteria bacterium]
MAPPEFKTIHSTASVADGFPSGARTETVLRSGGIPPSGADLPNQFAQFRYAGYWPPSHEPPIDKSILVRSVPDLSTIQLKDVLLNLSERVERLRVHVRIPLKPGPYDSQVQNDFIQLGYDVEPGFADVWVEIKDGKFTKLEMDFNRHIRLRVDKLAIPILGLPLAYLGSQLPIDRVYMVTHDEEGRFEGRVFLKSEVSVEITDTLAKFLNWPKDRLPLTLVEWAKAVVDRIEGNVKVQGTSPYDIQFIDYKNAIVEWGQVQLKPGPIKLADFEFTISPKANIFKVQKSTRDTIYVGPWFLQGLRWNQGAFSLGPIGGSPFKLELREDGAIQAHSMPYKKFPGLWLGASEVNFAEWNVLAEIKDHLQLQQWGLHYHKKQFQFKVDGFELTHALIKQGAQYAVVKELKAISVGLGQHAADLKLTDASCQMGALRLEQGARFLQLDSGQFQHFNVALQPRVQITGEITELNFKEGQLGQSLDNVDLKLRPSRVGGFKMRWDDGVVHLEGEEAWVDLNLDDVGVTLGKTGIAFPLNTDLLFRGMRLVGKVKHVELGHVWGEAPMEFKMESALTLTATGRGEIESQQSINRFNFKVENLRTQSEIYGLHLIDWKFQKGNLGKAEFETHELTGQVIGLGGPEVIVDQAYHFKAGWQSVNLDLNLVERLADQNVALGEMIAMFASLGLKTSQIKIHLNPERHLNGGQGSGSGDRHLLATHLDLFGDQSGSRALLFWDPKRKKVMMDFYGGKLEFEGKSKDTQVK